MASWIIVSCRRKGLPAGDHGLGLKQTLSDALSEIGIFLRF
jgi:hypothetical protein